MNFYKELELILESKNPHAKIEMFNAFYDFYKSGHVEFEKEFEAKKFAHPSYISTCRIVPPQDVPRRSNLTTKEGQIVLLHAIAHIEYSAIDLALDAAYRFFHMPKSYYDDWLEVADDEIRHFLMLEKLLKELGAEYGDIEVHNALFEASQRTQTLIERMAVVPRYLEANGLDATPMILTKLQRLPKSEMIGKITDALKIILDEEIAHVKKGDIWFNWACANENKSTESYFDIIQKYYPQGFLRAKNLNADARKEAGFSCKELNFMAHKNIC
ncbi:ferritin-like domain-containing protein [bacterium]|nr:ferritin-like domain-containing protein [bacterium]MBU1991205.1 ferritin-like domain-containing protein [bacterium]